MSILNRPSDGLYSILLAIVSALLREKEISRDEFVNTWGRLSAQADDRKESGLNQLRGTMNRWVKIGLFVEAESALALAIVPRKGETEESFLSRLPSICRRLVLRPENGNPLWPENEKVTEEDLGVTADFCRGLAWCLCQDIYSLPTSWGSGVNDLFVSQVIPGRSIIQNDTRWAGLQDWARFLGFAVDGRAGIFFDPTAAVQSEIGEFMEVGKPMLAEQFLSRLSDLLPVLDTGAYRREVETALRPERWTSPPVGCLSTSLSFALRRLQKQGVLGLETLSDAESRLTLTRQGDRTWDSFSHVNLLRKLT